MPTWTIIVVQDLNEARAAKLVEAMRTKALGESPAQPDPMPGSIQKIVDEVRGAIAFPGNVILDADPARVPPSLKDIVVQRIVRSMKGRLLMSLSTDESADERTYQDRLKQLIAGKWPVEISDNPATAPIVQSQTATVLVSASPRQTKGLRCL